jgi:hypothetical protein
LTPAGAAASVGGSILSAFRAVATPEEEFMRRPLGALTALALAALAGSAGAAEIGRVATSGEPGNPFDLDIGVRWDRTTEQATIKRERSAVPPPAGVPGGLVTEGDDLRYTRTRDAIVTRVAIGLWQDLDVHFELPYVLGDDREWRYGTSYGNPTGPFPLDPQSIAGNTIDAAGLPCTGIVPCPLFPVDPVTTGYHGGRAGDLVAGIAWGIFNDRKDDTKPFWLVGMDVTLPTSPKWEPGKGRTPDTWESPYRLQTKPGPFGEKIWKWDLHTVMSKRYGVVDPYVKAHARFAFKSASTYSNCDAVNEATAASLAAGWGRQMNDSAAANCASGGSAAGAKLPIVAGITLGTEIIPYEDAAESQRLSIDFRLWGDRTTSQRFYNELTDATGKLLQTEGFLEVGGLVGLYLRASKYVQLQARASLATRTAHYLTGEPYGKDGGSPPVTGTAPDPNVNPNFDWRWDPPGRRFRISEVSIWELSVGGVLQF